MGPKQSSIASVSGAIALDRRWRRSISPARCSMGYFPEYVLPLVCLPRDLFSALSRHALARIHLKLSASVGARPIAPSPLYRRSTIPSHRAGLACCVLLNQTGPDARIRTVGGTAPV